MRKYSLLLLFLYANVYAQQFRFYSGCGMDWAECSIETSSGQYLAGGSNSFDWGSGDIWITRTDIQGNVIWSRNYRVDHNYDAPNCIAEAPGHQIWIGYNQHFLMTIDTLGNLIRTVDLGSDIFLDHMFSTLSGTMLLHGTRYDPGTSDRHPMLAIMDTAGNVLDAAWYKVQDGNIFTSETVPFSGGLQLSDSSFTFAGTGYFPDFPFILHLEKDLTPSWHVSISKLCIGEIAILPAPDGGYFLNSLSSDTLLYHRHPILIKTNAIGTPTLVRTYNVDSNRWYTNTDKPKFTLFNNQLYVGGNVDGPAFDHALVLSLDTSGVVRWCSEYGHADYRYDIRDMHASDDSLRLFCTTNADTMVSQFSPYGMYQEDELVFGVDSLGNASLVNVDIPVTFMDHTPDTTHYTVQITRFILTPMPATLTADTATTEVSDSSLCIGVAINPVTDQILAPVLFPNPSTGTAMLKVPMPGYQNGMIQILDQTGRCVAITQFTPGECVTVHAPGIGVYIIRIPTDSGVQILRWVVVD